MMMLLAVGDLIAKPAKLLVPSQLFGADVDTPLLGRFVSPLPLPTNEPLLIVYPDKFQFAVGGADPSFLK
jgi:hypothetical protein